MIELQIRTNVPYGKPPSEPIRVRPAAEASFLAFLLEQRKGGEPFLLDASLRSLVGSRARSAVIRLAVNRAGEPFLIPEMVAGPDSRLHPWNVSRNAALRVAETRWVRMVPNLSKAAYQVFASDEDSAEPEWPEESIQELVKLAFAGRIIKDAGHPVIDRVLADG